MCATLSKTLPGDDPNSDRMHITQNEEVNQRNTQSHNYYCTLYPTDGVKVCSGAIPGPRLDRFLGSSSRVSLCVFIPLQQNSVSIIQDIDLMRGITSNEKGRVLLEPAFFFSNLFSNRKACALIVGLQTCARVHQMLEELSYKLRFQALAAILGFGQLYAQES